MATPLLLRTSNDGAVKVVEVFVNFNVFVAVSKTMLLHYMTDQGVLRAPFGIQITHHDHNV